MIQAENKKKVVVGMSGGVDSSVAAWLLKKQGYDVIGVTMQIWQDEEETAQQENGGCCGLSAVDDARRVAWQLEIPYYVMNFKKEFRDNVMDYFVGEYLCGTDSESLYCLQPLCKVGVPVKAKPRDRCRLYCYRSLCAGRAAAKRQIFAQRNSATAAKDQTYALYNLTQEQLSHTLMPVGEYTKDQIRQIAEDIGLQVAHKADSQEICFIPDNDYAGLY